MYEVSANINQTEKNIVFNEVTLIGQSSEHFGLETWCKCFTHKRAGSIFTIWGGGAIPQIPSI